LRTLKLEIVPTSGRLKSGRAVLLPDAEADAGAGQPTPGEVLFEFVVGHDRYRFELYDHGERGGCRVFRILLGLFGVFCGASRGFENT
jgi:hypothetical protein